MTLKDRKIDSSNWLNNSRWQTKRWIPLIYSMVLILHIWFFYFYVYLKCSPFYNSLFECTTPCSNYGISTLEHFLRPLRFVFIKYHHVVPLARISLTLARIFSLSFIASGRSSGLHPVSPHSCCMYVRAGRPAFAWPYAGPIGVHHWWVRPCFSSSVRRHFHTRRNLSETGRQIQLPRKQCLINRKIHRHTVNKGMDSSR